MKIRLNCPFYVEARVLWLLPGYAPADESSVGLEESAKRSLEYLRKFWLTMQVLISMIYQYVLSCLKVLPVNS